MAKIISIPDVHGSHKWEIVKSIPQDNYDYIVFHGDYFDSWENDWPDQGENFKAICNFVREDTEHRKLLIGNHDFSYLSVTKYGHSVSGHQHNHSTEIKNLLKQNLDIIDLAFECDGWIFSHAGFSKTWVKFIKDIFHSMLDNFTDEEFNIDFLNQQWHKLNHSNKEDNFCYSFHNLLDWNGFLSSSGNEVTQGPLWIRPDSLLSDAYYQKQVVGHTELCLFEKVYLHQNQNQNQIIFIDSKTHEIFDFINTSEEYNFMTIPEFNNWYKKTLKIINDIKAQLIYHNDEENFVKESLNHHFSKEIAEKIYKLGFM